MIITIHYEALEDLNALQVSSQDSGFPKENLLDRSPETWFKPDTTSAITITMDFGTGLERMADGLVLVGHDLYTQSSGIKLAYSATGVWGGEEVYVVGSSGAYHTAIITDEPIWREKFTLTPARRYWRLSVNTCTAVFHLGGIFLGSQYEGEVFLPRMRRLQPEVAVDYTHGGTRLATEKGTSKRYREYNTYSRAGSELSNMEDVADEIGSMYHSVVLYVKDESLLMQAEIVKPFQSSLKRHEDWRWKVAFLELPQV